MVVNEPAQIKCGAPDLIVNQRGLPIGYVECKPIGSNLDTIEETEQLKRYRVGLPNLILTNYLEFRWYTQGNLRQVVGGFNEHHGNITTRDELLNNLISLCDAFFTSEPILVKEYRQLAKLMAAKARLLKEGVHGILLSNETEWSKAWKNLLKAYRSVLLEELSEEEFADFQAQTVVYGLFIARILHGENPDRFSGFSVISQNTPPLLREVYSMFKGTDFESPVAWIVKDIVRLLADMNTASVIEGYGNPEVQDQWLIYFYEEFLSQYDPMLRRIRGVYYTPKPVVSFIVNSIDTILQNQFRLPRGLAHVSKAEEKTPEIVVLDPSAGTGTFLREVVTCIKNTLNAEGIAGTWDDYVERHLISRIFGFELLMAPYAICHLTLSLQILGNSTPRSAIRKLQRFNVFLTNTLDEPSLEPKEILFGQQIAEEANAANKVKTEQPVLVVLGNPPWSAHSVNNGDWINSLLRGVCKFEKRKTDSYYHENGHPLEEKNKKPLNNDYVKFLRFSHWRIDRTGRGLIGYVTSHSFLDGRSHRAMRQSLMRTFDEIYILDLHGDTKKHEKDPSGRKDENVFDITEGVAISLFVKTSMEKDSMSRVFFADLHGTRDTKFATLEREDVRTIDWTEIEPQEPLYEFKQINYSRRREYDGFWKLDEIFSLHSRGIGTSRDALTIHRTQNDVRKTVERLVQLDPEVAREEFNLRPDTGWTIGSAQRDIMDHVNTEEYIQRIAYRPFEKHFTWYSGRSSGFMERPRRDIMQHMINGENKGLVCSRQQSQDQTIWSLVGVVEHITDSTFLSNKTKEGCNLFPLYTFQSDSRIPNINQKLIDFLSEELFLEWLVFGKGDLDSTIGPESILNYIYAVLHCRTYRQTYADFLRTDFPRIPFLEDRDSLKTLVYLGEQLVNLHLWADDGRTELDVSFPRSGDGIVSKVEWIAPSDGQVSGRVVINEKQFFEGIKDDVWNFEFGSYKPIQRWLKDRKKINSVLTYEAVENFRNICSIVSKTIRLMDEVDVVWVKGLRNEN